MERESLVQQPLSRSTVKGQAGGNEKTDLQKETERWAARPASVRLLQRAPRTLRNMGIRNARLHNAGYLNCILLRPPTLQRPTLAPLFDFNPRRSRLPKPYSSLLFVSVRRV